MNLRKIFSCRKWKNLSLAFLIATLRVRKITTLNEGISSIFWVFSVNISHRNKQSHSIDFRRKLDLSQYVLGVLLRRRSSWWKLLWMMNRAPMVPLASNGKSIFPVWLSMRWIRKSCLQDLHIRQSGPVNESDICSKLQIKVWCMNYWLNLKIKFNMIRPLP